MAYRSRSRGYSRRSSYNRKSSRRGGRRTARRRSYGGGQKTVRIVVEQAGPTTGSLLPAPNAALQMASKRSTF